MSKNTNQEPISIKLPGNEFPYNQCIIEEGDISDMSQKLVFTTVSKVGNKRRITIHPNGVIAEQSLGNVDSKES